MSLETKIFEFDGFILDLSDRTLYRDGQIVNLSIKGFEILRTLFENRPYVVEKRALMEAVWPDSFVEEGNLTFTVSQLRRSLDDSKHNSKIIETVHRRGYRFIAEAKEILAERDNSRELNGTTPKDGLAGDGGTVALKPRTFNNSRSLIGFSVLMMLAALAFISWYFLAGVITGQKIPILSEPRRSEPLSYSGNFSHARISPNGKYIAYISQNQGTQTIWLRELATTTNLQLLPFSDEEYLNLMFSSNSDFVYFVRKPKGGPQDQASIFRISIFGGVPTRLVNDIQGWFSLSPIDDQIAFTRYEVGGRNVLMIADTDGNNHRILAARQSPHEFRANRWSPDGSSIACAVGQADNLANEFGVSLFDAKTGEENAITPQKFYYVSDLEWLPDQSGLLLTARENTSLINQIWQVTARNGKAAKLFDEATNYTLISLDKAGEKMVATQVAPDFHLSVFDLSNLNDPRATVSADSAAISFTPNGRILYTATTNGQRDIFSMNADGAEQRQLTNNNFDDFQPLASPDQRYIFFTSSRSGSAHVWRMNADGSSEIQITKTEGGFPLFIKPSGTLFYWSALNRNIWSVSISGGDETVFLEKRVLSPAFSHDGKFLAYFDRAGVSGTPSKLVVDAVDSKETTSSFDLFSEHAIPRQIAWSADGRSILYAASVASEKTLWQQPLDNKKAQKLADVGAREMLHFAVSPNGEKFAAVRGEWKRLVTLLKGLN